MANFETYTASNESRLPLMPSAVLVNALQSAKKLEWQ
jgi:hypothetical protein